MSTAFYFCIMEGYSRRKIDDMTVAVCLVLGGIINLYAELRQWVGLLAFGNRIAEKQIGGTYITTLNAFSNLG